MLELKRRGHARVKTEIVELIALPFLSSTKLKIWSFHVVVVQGRAAKKCTKKHDARAELLFCQLNLLLFDVAVAVAVVVSFSVTWSATLQIAWNKRKF